MVEDGFLPLIIKGVLLFTGVIGLFCQASLKDVINTSFFMKWIRLDKQSNWEDE
jgi:hypothetical protein